ncbi:Leucine Rich Repeat domain protein [Metarhizium anisopliae]|nr:Leucine Rich Repeat domain protein [Metarhizium anisopliae]
MARALSPSDTASRSSFSSVRENDDGLAQTFTRSKVSSYIEAPEDVFDESPISELSQPSFQAPLTQPHSKLHGFWYPPDSFKGWREIPIKGKKASRSFDDLRKLDMSWESPPASPAPVKRHHTGSYAIGDAPLERLPSEVLASIIDLLVVEIPPNGLTTRNTDLMALLLTSRSIHATTLTTLYRHVTIPHSRIFRKFLNTISEYPSLATIVRRLDFSHFNPSMLFSTASERAKTQNLTTDTLAQCLELTPYLQELSFHKCLGLPSTVFETILPRLGKLTHLDVAGTRITDEALERIPVTAELTHLNLAKCKELSADCVVKFVTSHPSTKDSLVFLSLATDPTNHLLLGKDDIDGLLPRLPKTLKSLSLRGSRMHASHIPELTRLAQTLEELAVGRGLEMSDIHKLFCHGQEWLQHNLRFLDICDIETIIGSASTLLAPASAPLHVIEIAERAYERAAKVNKNLQRVGWVAKEFGSRYWLVRMNADGSTRDNGGRWWKMGAESWGMRKVPVAIAEVGGMYGSFMFGRRV